MIKFCSSINSSNKRMTSQEAALKADNSALTNSVLLCYLKYDIFNDNKLFENVLKLSN